MAERQLLHGTLRGCIQVLSELLALASPKAFGRGEQSKALVADMVQILGLEGAWKYELAAMLSQIGCISLPPEILERKISGEKFSIDEEQIFLMHPGIAGNLLRNIPRLESVAEMVAGQELPLADGPNPGARILKAALDFTDMVSLGLPNDEALSRMRALPKVYDARVVNALSEALDRRTNSEIRGLDISELREGMLPGRAHTERPGCRADGQGADDHQRGLGAIRQLWNNFGDQGADLRSGQDRAGMSFGLWKNTCAEYS